MRRYVVKVLSDDAKLITDTCALARVECGWSWALESVVVCGTAAEIAKVFGYMARSEIDARNIAAGKPMWLDRVEAQGVKE